MRKPTVLLIKYKSNKYEKNLTNALSTALENETKEIRKLKDKRFDIVITKSKMEPKDLMAKLKQKKAGQEIQYIQPDYQLSLSSKDPYFDNQWGIQNTLPEPVRDQERTLRERLRRLPPHLRGLSIIKVEKMKER